jgi:serine acetyltransferase
VLRFHIPVTRLTKPFFRLLYSTHVFLRDGLLWAQRFFWCEPLFRSQCVAVGRGFLMEQLPYITGSGRITLGDGVELAGKSSICFGNRVHDLPEFHVGSDTFIGHGCSFNIAESLRIGNYCLIAAGVRIADFDGHPIDAGQRRAKVPVSAEAVRRVVIGDDVWVGAAAIILKGVTVGSRSVIGAGAVVVRDVPADVVVAGNPARVVKHLAEG